MPKRRAPLWLFKDILKLNQDSHPIKALSQEGYYMGMPGFLSIPYEMFPKFVVQELFNKQLKVKSVKFL